MTTSLALSPGPFFDASGAALAVLSNAGVVLRANAAFASAFGNSDIVGRALAALVVPADRQSVEVALGGGAEPVEVTTAVTRRMRVQITRGAAESLLASALPSPAQVNKTTEQAAPSLSEREASIAKKQAALDVLSCVLESAPLILWSADSTPTMLTSQGHGLARLGISEGQLVGMNALEMYKDAPEVGDGILRALAGEVVRSKTSPLPDVAFDNWMIPLRGADGVVSGVIGLAIDVTERAQSEQALREKLDVIERQNATIRELATPIINVWDKVLCLPVIGTVDSLRIATMMDTMLEAIVRQSARVAIVDLTGVEIVDTATADHLIRLFRAARLLGAEGIVCGIRPAVAQTVVTLGVGWEGVRTMRSLRDALKWCIESSLTEGT